jgi:hypothetical protein
VDAAVQDGAGVDPVRGEHARARSRRARRCLQIVTTGFSPSAVAAHAQQAVRDVARARDVAAVALVLLPHVEHLDLAGASSRSTSSSSIGASALVVGGSSVYPAMSEQRDGAQPARGALDLVFAFAAWIDDRLVGLESRNALFVENDDPSTGMLIAPCACPAENVSASRTSTIVAPSAIRQSGSSLAAAPRRTEPRLSATMRPCSAGAAASRRRTPRRSPPRSRPSCAWLKRRSKPIVDDAFELMPAPQSEPAT